MSATPEKPAAPAVAELRELDVEAVRALLARHGLALQLVAAGAPIPASYWGDAEAGVIGSCIHARPDTPVHSVLHCAGHLLVMTPERRARVHTDCGGPDIEEAAACYLQSLLAAELPGYSMARLHADMDAWGYTFRLGSAGAWFEHDAQDARAWLATLGLA